jgi:UDP-N-acetylmuramate-alanine ligase
MTDVYSAFENKARKISPKKFIYDVLKIKKTNIKYFDSFDTIVNKLYKIKSKDCKIRVITAGAGDVNRIAFMLKKKLRSNK